jgi:hypothetical protein
MSDFIGSPHVYTGRWGDHRSWPPGVTPVRISIGKPRFLPVAGSYDAINDLMPWGLFKITDRVEFTERFRRRLDAKGVDAIQVEFERLLEAHDQRPLMLLCYEDLLKPGEWCHRRTFSTWWLERTGQAIHDLQVVALGAGQDVTYSETPSDALAGIPDASHEHRAPDPPPPSSLF